MIQKYRGYVAIFAFFMPVVLRYATQQPAAGARAEEAQARGACPPLLSRYHATSFFALRAIFSTRFSKSADTFLPDAAQKRQRA